MMKPRPATALVGAAGVLVLAACLGPDAPDLSTPQGTTKAAMRALEDGRYADLCDLMVDVEKDCATDLATRAALGGADYSGAGDVQIDDELVQIDGDRATIPAEAVSWPGGRSYPYGSDETRLELVDGQWLMRPW